MAIKFESGALNTGEQYTHSFPNKVSSACVVLAGFDLGYDRKQVPATSEEGGDHHVQDIYASISILSVSDEKVTVQAKGEIKDGSGNSGGGKVTYTLIAETE